jgi:26S proteasome non-ATPase regulatory subunit 9
MPWQYTIRHTRAALARLETDRRTVTDLLAPALEAAFARGSASGSGTASASSSAPHAHVNGHMSPVIAHLPNGTSDDATRGRAGLPHANGTSVHEDEAWPERAVARVNTVDTGSPAAEAVSSGTRADAM